MIDPKTFRVALVALVAMAIFLLALYTGVSFLYAVAIMLFITFCMALERL